MIVTAEQKNAIREKLLWFHIIIIVSYLPTTISPTRSAEPAFVTNNAQFIRDINARSRTHA